MDKNYKLIICILFSTMIMFWGIISLIGISLNSSVWYPITATITKIDLIKKKTTKGILFKKVIHYNYIVENIKYNGTYESKWVSQINNNDDNQKINIYYHYNKPSISYKNKPREGVYRTAIGFILLSITILYFFNNTMDAKYSSTSENNLNNSIFINYNDVTTLDRIDKIENHTIELSNN